MGCSTLPSNLIKINVHAAEECCPHGWTRGSTTANKMQIQTLHREKGRHAYAYRYVDKGTREGGGDEEER